MSSSCVSLKLAVTQTWSSGMSVISGWPGWMTCPARPTLAADDALDRRLHRGVFEVELGLRRPRPAPACTRAAGGLGARPRRRHLLGRGLRRAQLRAGACCADSRLRQPALRHAGWPARLRAPATAPIATSARDDSACGHRGVVLLLRHLVLGQQPLQPLDVALVAHGRWPRRPTHAAPAPTPGAPSPPRGCAAPRRRRACACSTPPRADRHAAARRRRRNRHVGVGRRGLGLGVGQLGARAIERDLVVARIDLHEHGARLHRLVVGDRHAQHRAADARGHRRHVRVHLRVVGRLAAARSATTTRPTPAPATTTTATSDSNPCRHGIRAPRGTVSMACFERAGRAEHQRLGDVEVVERGDVPLAGQRHRLLRLHDLEVVGHAGGEPIARLRQLQIGELARRAWPSAAAPRPPAGRGTPMRAL